MTAAATVEINSRAEPKNIHLHTLQQSDLLSVMAAHIPTWCRWSGHDDSDGVVALSVVLLLGQSPHHNGACLVPAHTCNSECGGFVEVEPAAVGMR